MIKFRELGVDSAGRMESTTRTSWMANNAIPDSIIMNMIMICRLEYLLPPPVEPIVREGLAALTSKNTLRILYTIMPVIRAFTAMDKTKAVTFNVTTQAEVKISPSTNVVAQFDTSQVARLGGDKLKSAYYQINRLTDLGMQLLRIKERSGHGYFDPT